MSDKTAEQTAIRMALLANGYVPLANVSKKCMLKNWPRLEVDEAMINDWSDRGGLRATGVRIEGPLVALDFDIDDAAALDAIWAALPDDLFDLVDAMPVRRGGGQKVCLFCRVAGAKGVEHIWSKAFYRPDEADTVGAAAHRLEIFGSLSGGRQVGVYGAHTVEDGEVRVSYAWADARGLADIPLADLPELTIGQLESLADVVSEVLSDLGWVYEVRALDGRVSASRAYLLTGGEVFQVHGGGDAVGFSELEALARDWDGLRVSMAWREGAGAMNRTRGLVSINPADDRLQIWDTMTCVLYRPIEMDWSKKGRELGDRLRALGLVREDGGQAVSTGMFPVGSGGGGGGGDGDGTDADGGPSRAVVRVDAGRLAEAVRDVVGEMRGFSDVFDMGRPVKVVVGDDSVQIVSLDDARMSQEIGERFLCVREVERGRRVALEAVDPPSGLVKQALSVFKESRFRGLRGVVDMPVPDGSGGWVVTGYDPQSRLVVSDVDDVAGLLGTMTVAQALDVLWSPFREFPFVGAGDRGGALACLLTAVSRPWLETAPLFAFDAPAPGSGKSLLCKAVGELCGGAELAAPLPIRNEEETAKGIMALLMKAPRAVIWDNQTGVLDSVSLAAVLTSPVYSARELGHTRHTNVPTGVLWMMNGNNLAFRNDMPRRVVKVRIDPQTDTPFARVFSFDPVAEVRTNRRRMRAAALTLLSWGMTRAEQVSGRVGSFEQWDEVVAQTVAALGAGFGDPADSIRASHEDDPHRDELLDLLRALRDEFGNKWFSAQDVVARMAGGGDSNPLVEAVGLDVRTSKAPSSKAVGRTLTFRRDAVAEGMRLQVSRDPRTKVNRFRVQSNEDAEGVVIEGELERRRTEQKSRLGALRPT
jgi:hypothetical protein